MQHFFLEVSADVLRARIDAQTFTPDDPEHDARTRIWRKDQIARCEAAIPLLPADTVSLDGELPIEELATRVLEQIKAPPQG
ncbi:hypothetical protein [Streptomyces sp. NPDC051569]|uniref:hypothetical protein n=1 Tax=Streptomyces sp. NPDC051569 TaxID=3365661 RepID=UPI0037BCBF85